MTSGEDELIDYLRQMDRPGLSVTQLVADLERRRAERRWTTKCAFLPWRGGDAWVAQPSRDRNAVLGEFGQHMADEHPGTSYELPTLIPAELWGL